MQKTIINLLSSFWDFLFGHFKERLRDLREARDKIPFMQLVHDFFAVIQGTGFFGLLNLLAFLVFTLLPQGKDVLLVIVEEVGVEYRFGNLLFLIIGVFLWSVVSEFGSRYAINVTDNSGKNLNSKRVKWRKKLQEAFAGMFLMLPYIIVILGFGINYLTDNSLSGWQKNLGYGLPALLIFLVFRQVTKYYFVSSQKKVFQYSTGRERMV